MTLKCSPQLELCCKSVLINIKFLHAFVSDFAYSLKGKWHLPGMGEGSWEKMGQEQEKRRNWPESGRNEEASCCAMPSLCIWWSEICWFGKLAPLNFLLLSSVGLLWHFFILSFSVAFHVTLASTHLLSSGLSKWKTFWLGCSLVEWFIWHYVRNHADPNCFNQSEKTSKPKHCKGNEHKTKYLNTNLDYYIFCCCLG